MTTFSYTVFVFMMIAFVWAITSFSCGRFMYAQCHFLANIGRLINKQPLKFWDYQGFKKDIEEEKDRKEYERLRVKFAV